MLSTAVQMVLPGVGLLLILASGLWMRFSVTPMNVALSTIHKLLGLGVGVLLIRRLHQAHQLTALSAAELTVAVITGVFFVALAGSDAILSGEKPVPAAVRWVHRILPYLTALGSGGGVVSAGARSLRFVGEASWTSVKRSM